MSRADRDQCINETRILQQVQHAHIITCFDAFIENNEMYIVYEYAEFGDLSKQIQSMQQRSFRFSEMDLWRFAYCISAGIAHLHSQRIMHR